MTFSEDADSNSIYPTDFDIARILDMETGQKVSGELGNWDVYRYKNDYTLFLLNHKKFSMLEFKTSTELIKFLKKEQ